jgi:hypothetical protein
VNPEQASKNRRRECRPCHREGKAAAPGPSTVTGRATRRGNGEGTQAQNAHATRETRAGAEVAAPQRSGKRAAGAGVGGAHSTGEAG